MGLTENEHKSPGEELTVVLQKGKLIQEQEICEKPEVHLTVTKKRKRKCIYAFEV